MFPILICLCGNKYLARDWNPAVANTDSQGFGGRRAMAGEAGFGGIFKI